MDGWAAITTVGNDAYVAPFWPTGPIAMVSLPDGDIVLATGGEAAYESALVRLVMTP